MHLLEKTALLQAWIVCLGTSLPSSREMRVLRLTDGQGALERTVFLPPDAELEPPDQQQQQEDDEDDGYVLISDSSGHKFSESSEPRKKVVKKRRRKKKPIVMSNQTIAHKVSPKDPKFLNLFTIIKFGNDDCGEGGICYHEYECNQLGGTSQGPCARGFGVCCTLEVQCGETTSKAASVFVGGSSQGACTLTIEKQSCTKQIRLDFYNLELEPPVDGNCISDRLLITGHNTNNIIPIICGSNSGQHMHVDVDEVSGPIMVSVISPAKNHFRMKVSQLCDSDTLLAPKGCLQHFVENSGVIKSFNYVESPGTGSYMNNMNYAMCIKKSPGMCSVVYTNMGENGEEHEFDINNVDLDGDMTVPEGQAGAEVFNCPEDFLAVASVRLCGQKFNDATSEPDFTQNAPVYDKSNGPLMLTFVSSGSNTGRGFHLQYQQQPCETM